MSIFKINISGLKCDNKKCGYENPNIKYEDYPKYVQTQCPDCQEILLTQKDFKTCQRLKAIEEFPLIKLLNYVGDKLILKDETTISLDMDGSGKIKRKK